MMLYIENLEATQKLIDYGVVGAMLVISLFVIGFMFRIMMKFITQSEAQCRLENQLLVQKMNKLEDEFNRHRENDKIYRENNTEKLLKVIDRNSDLIEGFLKGK
jgi:hypothetical protein